MRILRIRVEHVRGIGAVDLALDPDGLTVIEAPNETGKSTLFDALDVLLTEKDATRKQHVRALQPVGRDVGSLVEAELRCGDTHFTLRKRFNKDRMTELEIHAPSPRRLSGDEAHDQVRRILDETTDPALAEALRFRQGRTLESVVLGDSAGLAARLDEIAGGEGAPGDDVLLQRVRDEYLRYHTPSGHDGRVLREAQERVAAAEEVVAGLATRASELDEDAHRITDLQREHARLTTVMEQLEPAMVEHRRRRERVRSLREELRTRQALAEVAEGQLERAEREAGERARRLAAIEELSSAVQDRAAPLDEAQERLAVHEQRLADCSAQVEVVEEAEHLARTQLDAARAAAELGRRREELEALTARQRRIERALAEAADAEAELEARPAGDEQLRAVREAHDRLRLAEARRADAAPTWSIRAEQDLDVDVDGESRALRAGERAREPVTERSVLRLPGIVEIEIEAGTSLSSRQADLHEAERALADACAVAGVADPREAVRLEERRRSHRRAIEERDALIARELAGWSREELAERIRVRAAQLRDHEARVDDDDGGGIVTAQLAFEVTSGLDRLAAAEARDVAARDAAEQARAERAGLAHEIERLRAEVRVAQAAADQRRQQLADETQRLAADREQGSDEAVDAAVDAARASLAAARRRVDDARSELDRLGADEVELLAGNAHERMERTRDELARVRDELTELRARVEVRGGEGIGEALQTAEAERDRASHALHRLRARSEAARVLREAFEQARDRAYDTYREPLRDRIARAGRVVFGEGFDVELDDELRVVARVLDGIRLEWDALSAGAREQLAILTALAAADLAAADQRDGVPLVLDDVLGHTDPARLERLCAVLGRVRGPQVVVLTCVAERLHAVGRVRVVRLADEVLAPGRTAAVS